MVKILFCIFVQLLIPFSYINAQPSPPHTAPGSFTVFSENGERFILYLNGLKCNYLPESDVRIEGIPYPVYSCRIAFDDIRILPLSYLDLGDAEKDAVYIIDAGKKGSYSLRSYNTIPEAEVPHEYGNMVVYQYGRPDVLLNRDDPQLDKGHFIIRNKSGNCHSPMSYPDFEQAVSAIERNSFDDTRFRIARQVIYSHCMRTDQIATIMGIFSFDQTRLDFAKYAFPYCTDQGQYYRLFPSLFFESSRKHLILFLQKQ